MEFYETKTGRLGFREIPPILAELLRQIPAHEEYETEDVQERFFPNPSLDEEEEELREDWKAHVQPELHEQFQSARQVVEVDLRGMKEENDWLTLEFPRRHAESWLNALNQARLALAARHGFSETELSRHEAEHITNERDLALFQIDFYGQIQYWLVEILD